jgi:ubiquitin carboxyl-terminal hydrolase 25/28
MATLFRRVKTALQDVDSIENDIETEAGDGSDSTNAVAGAELLDELECLAHKAENDLQGKSSTLRLHLKQAY